MQKFVENGGFLDQISSNIEQVIWLRDNASGQILYVNPTFESVWGRTCESLYANPKILIESVHPEDRVQVMVARDRSNHKPFDQVYRIFRPDGSLRWISTHSFLVRTGVEKYPIQVYIAQDVTRHNQVDQALRKALDRSREQFTLSRRMSLARKPEAVLKALMSAHELRSAQRAALVFFDNPKAGPGHGIELSAAWVSSPDKPAWLSESALYEEQQFWDLYSQPGLSSSMVPAQTPISLPFCVTSCLKARSNLLSFSLWSHRECGLAAWQSTMKRIPTSTILNLRHLKVLIDQATITLYNLKLLEIEADIPP